MGKTAMTQQAQQQDMEQRERQCYEVADRLYGLVMANLLDVKDFEHCLLEFGILTDWKRSHT